MDELIHSISNPITTKSAVIEPVIEYDNGVGNLMESINKLCQAESNKTMLQLLTIQLLHLLNIKFNLLIKKQESMMKLLNVTLDLS